MRGSQYDHLRLNEKITSKSEKCEVKKKKPWVFLKMSDLNWLPQKHSLCKTFATNNIVCAIVPGGQMNTKYEPITVTGRYRAKGPKYLPRSLPYVLVSLPLPNSDQVRKV